MIARQLDIAMRQFERRNASPDVIKKTAGGLHDLIAGGLDRQTIREIQSRRLRRIIDYVYRRSPFYRTVFDNNNIKPADIHTPADLQQIPFTTSQDIRDWQRFLCVTENNLAAVFTTSGTTGEPKRIYYTYRDLQALTNLYAVTLRFAHPGRIVALIALPLGHGLWIGSASVQRAVERAGGLPLPVGTENPRETIKWMKRFEPNIIFSSPSNMTVLTREAEQLGYRPKIEKIWLGGEVLTDEHKEYFSTYWGAQVFNSYGSTEIGSAQTLSLPYCTAFHLNDLHLITEIIDPDTGEPAKEGELVFTTLRREAMPLIRYRSGDRGRWSGCGCWLPLSAIELAGRTDDMVVAGNMNLYGRIIAEAVAKIPGTTGRIAIELEKNGLTDLCRLNVEGSSVEAEAVKQALFAVYPELKANTENGNLILVIQTGVGLGNQIKNLKIIDKRKYRNE